MGILDTIRDFRRRKAAGKQRALAQARSEQANAERTLREDDARFHGRQLRDPESAGYQSAIGEGWEDDDEPTRKDW